MRILMAQSISSSFIQLQTFGAHSPSHRIASASPGHGGNVAITILSGVSPSFLN
jgi:hypothetical protein